MKKNKLASLIIKIEKLGNIWCTSCIWSKVWTKFHAEKQILNEFYKMSCTLSLYNDNKLFLISYPEVMIPGICKSDTVDLSLLTWGAVLIIGWERLWNIWRSNCNFRRKLRSVFLIVSIPTITNHQINRLTK